MSHLHAETVSTSSTYSTAGTYVIFSTSTDVEYVVKGVGIEKDVSGNQVDVTCKDPNNGTTTLVRSFNSQYLAENTGFVCQGKLFVTKTGSGQINVAFTYMPDWEVIEHEEIEEGQYNFFTSTATTSSATNTAQYINGFSYGEILIAFFLLIVVTNAFFGGILNRLIGVKQKTGYKIILK